MERQQQGITAKPSATTRKLATGRNSNEASDSRTHSAARANAGAGRKPQQEWRKHVTREQASSNINEASIKQ